MVSAGNRMAAVLALLPAMGWGADAAVPRFLKMVERPRVALQAASRVVEKTAELEKQHFTYASEAGQRVPGIAWKSASASGRLPVVIVLHGTGGTKEGNAPLLRELAGRGFLAVAIDGRYHGERSQGGRDRPIMWRRCCAGIARARSTRSFTTRCGTCCGYWIIWRRGRMRMPRGLERLGFRKAAWSCIWVNPPATKPAGVQHRTLRSTSMNREVGYNIYLPPDYESSGSKRYPVIYWLHGAGGNESSTIWVAEEYQKAIQANLTEPAILVFPNGGRRTEYRDWKPQNVMPETMIIRELIPHIDATFRTIATPEARMLEGMSMGANGALKLAFKYPEMFHSVVAYAGSYKRLPLDGYFAGISPEQQAWIARLQQWWSADDDVFELANRNSARLGQLRIRLIIGSKDVAFDDSEALHPWLKARGIPHEYEILLGVSHDTKAYYARAGAHGFGFHFIKFNP